MDKAMELKDLKHKDVKFRQALSVIAPAARGLDDTDLDSSEIDE